MAFPAPGWFQTVQLLGQLQKCRIESTAITHAAVLSSLGSLEHGWRMAVDFLQDMRRESMFPNMIHYNSVTSALASSSSSWSKALMMKSMDTVGMNAKLHALGAVEWRSTTENLSRMRSSSILQDVISFNTALKSSSLPWEHTLELLRMQIGNLAGCVRVDATQVTLNSAISSVPWHHATCLLAGMLASLATPVDSISLNSAMAADGTDRPWQRPMSLLEDCMYP
eukprot:symbB.v1.2.001747.t1/scaffold94.1/size335129/11